LAGRRNTPIGDWAGRALDRARLLRPATRTRDRLWARLFGDELPTGPDGLPVPPRKLRVGVASRRTTARDFLARGADAAETIRAAASSCGVELEELDAILDFGCGCGRVARYWVSLAGPEVHGCDVSRKAVEWCARHLDFVEARVNRPKPPAPYESETFDLIYALSVFTHLPERLQRVWMRELARIAKPRGLLVLTTHGDSYSDSLLPAERAIYERGEMVVKYPRSAGANVCGAYHPREAMERLLDEGGWEPLWFERGGPQDLYVARATVRG
jgi:SAM-dependent methyltransferase